MKNSRVGFSSFKPNCLSFFSCEQIKYLINYYLLFQHVSHDRRFLQVLDTIAVIITVEELIANEMPMRVTQLIISFVAMLLVSSCTQAMMGFQLNLLQQQYFAMIINLQQWLVEDQLNNQLEHSMSQTEHFMLSSI